ncbi:hypothetical protein [Gloeothece verrucosa]|uniref:Uncharacterized protein n=1 Tax=Gloeothece verrucosa (strain PCC 7822) TaxID=497965 RepID=E0UME3_GLOV7|nr:hypothetical protein [Gloeothece verrucosa]ADN18123.1 hypothetical protein Cyan7822_6329 [Gloeothece verrucosa PCC 7822]
MFYDFIDGSESEFDSSIIEEIKTFKPDLFTEIILDIKMQEIVEQINRERFFKEKIINCFGSSDLSMLS